MHLAYNNTILILLIASLLIGIANSSSEHDDSIFCIERQNVLIKNKILKDSTLNADISKVLASLPPLEHIRSLETDSNYEKQRQNHFYGIGQMLSNMKCGDNCIDNCSDNLIGFAVLHDSNIVIEKSSPYRPTEEFKKEIRTHVLSLNYLYRKHLKMIRSQGYAKIQMEVNPDGNVQQYQIIDATIDSVLLSSLKERIENWTFSTTACYVSTLTMKINFTLLIN